MTQVLFIDEEIVLKNNFFFSSSLGIIFRRVLRVDTLDYQYV